MSVLPNPKHERFAQLVAVGDKTQTEAYELAGYRPDRAHASRLASNGNIEARVAEIQAEGADHAALSRAALLARMYDLSLKAEADGNWTGAIRATEKVGQEAQGMFKERSEIEQKVSPRDMSDDEISQSLFQNLCLLGVPKDIVALVAAALSQTGEADRVQTGEDAD